jgi:hypothetical protein
MPELYFRFPTSSWHITELIKYRGNFNVFSLVVKALGYKQKGHGFEARWGEVLNVPNPSGHTRPWGLLSL